MKKRKSKIICIIIAVFSIICMLEIIGYNNESKAATMEVDGLTWTYTVSNGNAINVFVSSGTPGETLTIPATLGGYTVTEIKGSISGANILNSRNANTIIKEVIIPDTVTTIGDYSFYKFNALEEIIIPNSVNDINNYAFYQCSNLKTVNLGTGVENINSYAFAYCSKLSSISLSNTITKIGQRAFYSTGISGKLTIPESTKIIDSYAFYNCSKLSELELNEGLISIGSYAFYNCNGIKGDLIIPDSVTTLASGAFQNCSGFDGNLIVGNGVSSILGQTFTGCNNFKKITLGTSITSIGAYSLPNISDIWIKNIQSNVSINDSFAGTNSNIYIHWLDDTHNVRISTVPGVKLVRTDTNEILTTGEYICESKFDYKIEIENGYTYDNLKLVIVDNEDYDNYSSEDVNINKTYSFSNLIRNREIYVQNFSRGLDLSLRTFITEVNRKSIFPSRVPVVRTVDAKIQYLHTKYPVTVKTGDLITYKIRVYNESATTGTANIVKIYVPEGLEFDSMNRTNINNKWTGNGNVFQTSILASKEIKKYSGNGRPNYEDIEVALKVTKEKNDEKDTRLNIIAEIAESSDRDVDATNGSINSAVSSEYKEQESYNSNPNSYIPGQEDDDDFENVLIIGKIKVDYGIKITKVDADTKELLKGATFNLLDKDEKIIKKATTDENGLLDFGTLTSYGEGEDIYYIEEAKTPKGYIPVQDKKLKVTVIKTIIDEDIGTYSVKVICESLDYNVDTTRYEYTPIKTKEQLKKIGSGETIEIDGVQYEYNANTNYKLMEDIDLAGENWIPISNDLKCIIDGNNHKISNLTIIENNEANISEIGLFGDFSGIIQNLELENVNIAVKNFSEDAESVTGYTGIGAFVGVMNEGFIINCKVSGNITGGCDNIGGFVGHTVKGKIVKIQKSINTANVSSVTVDINTDGRIKTVGGKNAGGFVGCALGAISVTDSINEGNIKAVLYNAGGMVGYTEATEYSESDIIADFDEGDRTINLVVENKNIQGRYVIYLQNIDAHTLGLVSGGVYKVLDRNKNEIQGLENVTLNTGKIELTSVDINTLGIDVYYIKEVTPAGGYEKLNSYIKLSVTRYWDENLKDYRVTIAKDFVEDDEINTDDPEDSEEGLPSKTGDIFTKVEFVNATWNSNKAEFKYCTNTGNIRADFMNAAGIVGNSHCIVDINGCDNTGEIYSLRKSGGIISELQTEKLMKFSNIKSCENTGIVTSGIEGNGYEGSAGGIVSNAIGNLKVTECNNKGDVTGYMNQASAGIVAHMIGELTVESCKNEGLIYAKNPSNYPNVNSVAGGIVGKNRINLYTYPDITKEKVILKINNCQNYGDVKASCHLGGIVGLTCAEMVEISNCEVKNVNINDTAAGDKGGIVGFSSNNKITITDCNVENVKIERLSQIHNTYGGTAGVIGCVNKYGDENTTNVDTIIIGNCNVINCVMQSIDKETAGILGSEVGVEVTTMNYIYDCNVKDCTIINKYVTSSYSSSGGIVGGSYTAGYEISNCLVENTNISSEFDRTRNGNDCNVGGIIGVAYSAKVLNINKCDVINSNIFNDACPTDGCANAGGIVGFVWISSYSEKGDILQVIDCNLVDTELKTTAGNLSGILACNYASGSNVNALVDGCIVNNCIITSTADTSSCTDTAGIVAYSYVNSEINNCKVVDTKITGDGRNTSGILGYEHASIKMNNIEVIRTDVKGTSIGTSTYYRNNDCVAGVLGGVNAEYNINNVKVDSCNLIAEYAGHTGNVAGVIGEAHASNTEYVQLLKNCIVSETNIISNAEISPYNTSNATAAGLISRSDNANIINCNVVKCNISGKLRIVAGGIASAEKLKAENCLVADTEIKNEYKLWDLYQGYQTERVASGFVGSVYNAEIIGIKVSDVTLLGNSDAVGGVYGYVYSLDKLRDITVEGLRTSTHDIEHITNGASAGIGANTNMVNCVIEDCKVNNSEINTNDHIASGMFGYISYDAKLNNCNTDNVTITHYNTFNSQYDPAVAGLIGLNAGKIEVTNSSVKNANIISKNGTKSSIHTGGLIGFIAGDAIVDTVNIINTKIENDSATGITGGIAGMTNYDKVNNIIKTLTIKNSKIENCKNIVGNNHVGAILGFGKLIANNNNILETIIESLGTFGDVGGIAGNTLNGTIVDGVTANKIAVLSQYRSGGIIGYSEANVTNVNISNSNISATGEYAEVGGIAGVAVTQISEISKCKANNVEVTSVNGYVGGIVGLVNNQNVVKDCTVTHSTVTATGDASKGVGGIAGFGLIDTNIQNPTISENTITGSANTGDIVGAPVSVNLENNVAETSNIGLGVNNSNLENNVENLDEELQQLDDEIKIDTTEAGVLDNNLDNDSTETSSEKIILLG